MIKNKVDGVCPCQDTTVLTLSRVAVSRMVATGSLACFFIFVAGYFWGKKHAAESFMTAINEEALADKTQVALTTIAPVGSPFDAVSDAEEEETSGAQVAALSEQEPAEPMDEAGKMYRAQLVGFGSERNANQFVKKLARRGITDVVIAPQTSRMSGGRKRTWYQVVTKPFADHQRVVALVDRIKQIEKLHDVRIVAHNA